MQICKCVGADEAQIARSIRSHGLLTLAEVTLHTRAGGGCTSCHADIVRLLALLNEGSGIANSGDAEEQSRV